MSTGIQSGDVIVTEGIAGHAASHSGLDVDAGQWPSLRVIAHGTRDRPGRGRDLQQGNDNREQHGDPWARSRARANFPTCSS